MISSHLLVFQFFNHIFLPLPSFLPFLFPYFSFFQKLFSSIFFHIPRDFLSVPSIFLNSRFCRCFLAVWIMYLDAAIRCYSGQHDIMASRCKISQSHNTDNRMPFFQLFPDHTMESAVGPHPVTARKSPP